MAYAKYVGRVREGTDLQILIEDTVTNMRGYKPRTYDNGYYGNERLQNALCEMDLADRVPETLEYLKEEEDLLRHMCP